MRRDEWALIGMLALVYAPALRALAGVWFSVDYYSQGFLIPVVAYWILRRRARGLGPRGRDPRGGALLVAALCLYALGLFQGSVSLQGLSLVAAVAAVVAIFWGLSGLRRLAFPVAFLLFMLPIPPRALAPVIVWLQMQVTKGSVALLHAMGYSVLREGSVVLLPGGASLFVAEACSGITSIVTLLPLGVVLGHFSGLSRARGLLLVLAVVPVAMAGNFLRVLVTVAAASRYGVERATSGPLHESAGLLAFVVECLVLVGLVPLLRAMPRLLPGGARRADAA